MAVSYVIRKVLNSSVVLVADEQGHESILLGKGIGYGKKRGEHVADTDQSQVFVPVEADQSCQMQQLVKSLAPEVIEVTKEIIEASERLLGVELSKSVYLVLADHLNFAIERMKQGIRITNRVFWEIKNYYPDEFRAGLLGIELVRERMGVELPEEEAANLAFHIANACAADADHYDAIRYAKVIGKVINLTVLSLNRAVDPKSIHYLRFVTHIKYFVERYFTNKMLEQGDDLLFLQLLQRYPREIEIAGKIKSYMEERYGSPITQDELVYLVVHIARLNAA